MYSPHTLPPVNVAPHLGAKTSVPPQATGAGDGGAGNFARLLDQAARPEPHSAAPQTPTQPAQAQGHRARPQDTRAGADATTDANAKADANGDDSAAPERHNAHAAAQPPRPKPPAATARAAHGPAGTRSATGPAPTPEDTASPDAAASQGADKADRANRTPAAEPAALLADLAALMRAAAPGAAEGTPARGTGAAEALNLAAEHGAVDVTAEAVVEGAADATRGRRGAGGTAAALSDRAHARLVDTGQDSAQGTAAGARSSAGAALTAQAAAASGSDAQAFVTSLASAAVGSGAAEVSSPHSTQTSDLPMPGLAALASSPGAGGALGAAPAPAEGRLSASPGSPAFATELGAQLRTYVRAGVEHAVLELHPLDMGPLTLQIQLDGQTAQVHMSASHADTRQALEQAMPQLAGSLREAGITLGGGGVSEQPRQPQPEDSRQAGRGAGASQQDSAGRSALPAPVAPRRRGVVDLVA